MADLKISPNEIRDALKDFVKSYEPAKASKTEVGHVIDAGEVLLTSRVFHQPWLTSFSSLRMALLA